MLRPAVLAFAIAAIASTSRGSTLHYVVSGEFSSAAPVSDLTAPDTVFSIVFDMDSSPSPYASLSNQSDLILPGSTTYTLGGNSVALGSTNTLALYPSSSSGGIGIILTDAYSRDLAFYFYGPQIFTGATSAPNLIYPETYTPETSSRWVFFVDGPQVANGTFIQPLVTNSPVPEPSSFALISIGLALSILLRRHAAGRAFS
jgi:hypothetical protein